MSEVPSGLDSSLPLLNTGEQMGKKYGKIFS